MNGDGGKGVEGQNRFEKRPKAEVAEQEEAEVVREKKNTIYLYSVCVFNTLTRLRPDKVLHFVNVNC